MSIHAIYTVHAHTPELCSMHAYIICINGSQLNEQKMQQEVGKNSGCFDLEGLRLLG